MIAVLAGMGFFGLAVVGIIAAISIPAYQDYNLRAQVQEGVSITSDARAAVAKYYMRNQAWPVDADEAGLSETRGKYVESVTVENGSVVVLYGGASHKNIAGKTLIMVPGVTAGNGVEWMCASGEKPNFVEQAPGPYGTDLPTRYLPPWCRQ